MSEADRPQRPDGTTARPAPAAAARSAPAPRPARRGPAWLALLLASVALVLAAWPFWLRHQGEDELGRLRDGLAAEFDTRLAKTARQQEERLQQLRAERDAALAEAEERGRELDRRLGRSEQDLQRLRDAVRSQAEGLTEQEREFEARVTGLRRAFAELAGDVARAGPPDSLEWRLAEAAYLMRIANQRARLERDLRGAGSLLQAADAILAELDDYSLVPVREALVAAKAALAARPEVDRVELYLQLEALARLIDALPLEPPRLRPAPAPPANGEGIRGALERRLGALLDFRVHRPEPVRPLLLPDDSLYWHHNVRLVLAQAQLAALRGEQAVWEATLARVAALLRQADVEAALLGAVDALAEQPVTTTVPDISEPLRLLEQLRSREPGVSP